MNRQFLANLSLAVVPVVLLLGVALAQMPDAKSGVADPPAKMPLTIVPIVSLKPGETKELLLSTHCTVGATRGGGFGIAEMADGGKIDGKTEGYEGAEYARDGVVIKVPGWDAATKFSDAPRFAALKKRGIQAFTVTVSASPDAKPGLMELHLVDATCSGHCQTDFRVLVLAP